MDPEQQQLMMNLRMKNALWRSWSIEGLNAAASRGFESFTARPGPLYKLTHHLCLDDCKASPKTKELLRESLGCGVYDSLRSPVVELVLKSGGDFQGVLSGMSAPPSSSSAGDVGQDSARVGQLFGHPARRSGSASGTEGNGSDQSPSILLRDDTGVIRQTPGQKLTSFDHACYTIERQGNHLRLVTSTSSDPVHNSGSPPWLEIPRIERLSDSALRGSGAEETSRRAPFVQARDHRRRELNDNSVSPFLGDELSVHRNDCINTLNGACATASSASAGTSVAGTRNQVGITVRAKHISIYDGAHRPDCLGHPKAGFTFNGTTDNPLGRTRTSGSNEELNRVVNEQEAGMFRGDLGAVDPAIPMQASQPQITVIRGDSQPSTAVRWITTVAPTSLNESPDKLGLGLTPRLPPSQRPLDSQGLSGFGRSSGKGSTVVNEGVDGSRVVGGEEIGSCRLTTRLASAPDELDEDQDDHGQQQPVMLPLLDWKDWSTDRLHWTYPAVVRAFPTCLFDPVGASPESRGQRSERRAHQTQRSRGADANGAKRGWETRDIDDVVWAQSSRLPCPFEPYSLGEVFVRSTTDEDLAVVGVGGGPWRRRWLVLLQTYLFELLQPPPQVCRRFLSPSPLPPPSRSRLAATSTLMGGRGGDGGVEGAGGGTLFKGASAAKVHVKRSLKEQEKQARAEGTEKIEEEEAERLVAPAGFLCLSRASVKDGGRDWGPRTLLLRCLTRPPEISREEASSRGAGGNTNISSASFCGGNGEEEICVELRVPSEDVGTQWTELFRSRAVLEMSTIFEPTEPDFETRHPENEDIEEGEDLRKGSGSGGGLEAKAPLETDASFSVVGTGRFSKVVWAKRRRPWGTGVVRKEGGDRLSTVKIVDKQAFWARVRSGKERADALAREVFCQTVLTRHNTDVDDSFDAISKREGVTSEARHGGSYNQPRFGCDCGGGIVRLHSVLETATELVLEMDLMSRIDLFHRLEQRGKFSEPEAASIIHNTLVTIDKCQARGFCHRDVKPSNLLYPTPTSMHGPECVALTNFGMATMVGQDGLVRGRCGTSGYVAPEILKAQKSEGYSGNVDVFSAGVVLYACLCGYEPFYGVDDHQLLAANKAAVVKFHELEWEHVSQGARDLVSKMLESDPSKRISSREALRHPWVASNRRRAHAKEDGGIDKGRVSSS